MSWSIALWLSVAMTLVTLTKSDDDRSLDDVASVDRGMLERFLLQRARVEAVKRGILQQLGLTEAPRPPAAHNRSSPGTNVDDDGGGDDGRRVMATYRRTVAQTRHHAVSNDVVDDVTGNDVAHGDAPSARQFYSFKGHGKLLAIQQTYQHNNY